VSSPRFPYYKFLNVLHFAGSSDRKMCVVLQHILARGPLRAPVASPSPWLFQGIEPIPEPADRIAGQPLAGLGDVPLHLHRTMDQRAYRRPLKPTRKGAFGAPLHPIDLAGVPAPKTPDHFMETTSSRPWKGAFALPCPRPTPTTWGPSAPRPRPCSWTSCRDPPCRYAVPVSISTASPCGYLDILRLWVMQTTISVASVVYKTGVAKP